MVEIELEGTTGTGPHFPATKFFALALLHECATGDAYSQPGRLWSRSVTAPIESVATFDEILDLSSLDGPDRTKDRLADAHIVFAAYCDTRRWRPSLWTADAAGLYEDPKIPWPDPRVRAAMSKLQAIHDAQCAMRAPLPSATLRIEVTNEAWSTHVEPGMLWDVYAFDKGAGSGLL